MDKQNDAIIISGGISGAPLPLAAVQMLRDG